MEEKKVPPAEGQQQQDTEQKKFADKFKSVEELEKAYKEAEQKLHEMAERYKRAEELLDLYMTSPTPSSTLTSTPQNTSAVSDDYYNKIIENPKEALEKFGSELEQRIIGKIKAEQMMIEQMKRIYEYFYTKYSDLKGYEPIVGYYAEIYQKQYPNEKLDTLLDKIAEGARAYIADKKLKSQQPSKEFVGVAEPSSAKQSSSAAITEEEKILSPEEELQMFLEERKKEREKKL